MTDDELYDNMVREEQSGQLAQSAIISHNVDPDKYAANRNEVRSLGLPVSIAKPAKKPTSVNNMTNTVNNFNSLLERSPRTATFLITPEYAKLTHDDTENLSAWEDFFKPVIHTAASMVQMPISGLSAAAKLVTSGGDLAEANKVLEENQAILDEALLTTPKSREVSGFISKAMIPFQMAGRGWAGLAELPTGGLAGAEQVVAGTDAGSNIMVPVMGTIGEASAMFGLGEGLKVAKARADIIKKALDTTKKVKVGKRDPVVAKQFFKAASEDAVPVKMPVEKFDEILAESRKTPDDVLDNPDQYYDAKFRGEPVEIPVSDLAAMAEDIKPEHINEMKVGEFPSVSEMEMKVEEAKAKAEVKALYHVTKPDNVPFIKDEGILAKKSSKRSNDKRLSDSAVYGFKTEQQARDFAYDNNMMEDYVVLKIDAGKYELVPDTEYANGESYGIKGNVSPEDITIINSEKISDPLSTPSPGEKLQPQGEFGGRTPEGATGGNRPSGDTPGGTIKDRGLSKNIEGSAIDAEIIKKPGELGDLPVYEVRTKPQEKIALFVDADPVLARRVADGLEPPPSGLLRAEVFTEIRKRATEQGDVDTLMELLNSPMAKEGTELGREIQALDAGVIEGDPFRAAQEVITERQDRAKKTGIKPEGQEKIDELTAKLTAAEEKMKAYEEQLSKKKAEKVIKEIVQKESKKATRAETKQTLDAEFKDLTKKLNSILNPNRMNVGIPVDAVPVLLDMAKNRIKSGLTSVEAVVDSIHAEVKQFIDITKREIRDAISGYGKTFEMSQEDIKVKLRELKRQAQLISAFEDAKAGEAPLRTGMQRDPVSDKVRELQKQVKDAMRESGIDSTRSPEEQWKSALDARKTSLKNQIADLEKQIATGVERAKKEALKYDKEANDLKAERDKLSEKWKEKKALLAEMKKKQTPDEDPQMVALKKFMADTERQIKAKEKALDKAIEEKKRRIAESDLTPQKAQSATPQTPEIAKKQAQLDNLNEEYKQLQKEAKPPKEPKTQEEIDAAKLKSFKTRVTNEIAALEKKLSEADLTKTERKSIPLDAEGKRLKAERDRIKEAYKAAVDASGTIGKEEVAKLVELSQEMARKKAAMEQGGNRLEYGAAKVTFEKYVDELRKYDAPLKTLAKNRAAEFKTTAKDNVAKAVYELGKDTITTITNNSISMVATLDNSFLGRQGLKTLMTHPSAWWPGAKMSFVDFVQTLGGKNAHDALLADIYSRPNYVNGEYMKAKILAKNEEQYPATLAERLPGVGRVFRASEFAFTGSALRMRTGLYDLLATKAKENGVNMASKAEAESLGKLINSLTARGQWGKRGEGPVVRIILWAPKMLKGNIDVLTAHNFGAGLESSFARKQAAMNLVKIVAETATVMMIADALMPGSVEYDPRSTDFGKIQVNDTRFDITGGAGSIVTLAARIATRSTKSTQTDLVVKYGLGYGQPSPFDALVDFLVNKTSPPTKVVVDWLKGENREGEPFTFEDALYRAVTPISLQNAIKAKDDVSADKVAAVLLDVIGVNANTYGDEGNTRRDIVNRMRKGKDLTPEQEAIYEAMTDQQRKGIDKSVEMTTQQEAFSNLAPDVMVYAWAHLNDAEREELRDIYETKINKYIMDRELEGEELDSLIENMDKAENRQWGVK